jgi:IPT/TIG domain-containing protein
MALGSHPRRPLIAAAVLAAVLAIIPGWAPAFATTTTPTTHAGTVVRTHAATSAARSSPAPQDTGQSPPLLAFSLPTTNITTAGQTFSDAGQLVLQASGPCDPMIEVLASASTPNQWNEPHADAKYTSLNGKPWAKPGYGCGAEAFLGGTQGGQFDLSQGTDPTWNMTCSGLAASKRSAPGAECLGLVPNPADVQNPINEYAVPSPTVQIPVSCLFNYDAPSGYFPTTGQAINDPDANNSSPGLDGNTLHCSVQAQQYVPGVQGAQGSWQDIGSPLSLTSAIPSCSSPATCPNQNVNDQQDLTIALPQQEAVQGTELRLSYSADVDQDGSVDGSGINDNPIGDQYCVQAIADAAIAKQLGDPVSPNYYACVTTAKSTATVGIATGTTPAAMFVVEPTGLAQLAVMPYKIIYQPPGDGSTAGFSVSTDTATSTKVSLAKSVANSSAEDTSTTLGGSAGGGIGDFFTANISYSHTWETNEANTQTQASSNANEDDITDQVTTSWTAGANPGLDDPSNPPWSYDVVSLMVHPQFALWDLTTCSAGVPYVPAGSSTPACPAGATMVGGSGEEPVGTQYDAEASETIGQLLQAAQAGKTFTLPSIYDVKNTATGQEVPVVLTNADLWSLIGLDPFAATALGLETPPPGTRTVPSGPGQAVDPAPLLATPGEPYDTKPFTTAGQGGPGGAGGTFTLGKALNVTNVQAATTDVSSTYDAQVTDISANKVSVEEGLSIPIADLFTIKAGATASYSTTSTTGVDAKVTYDTTDTTADTIATSTTDTFNDAHNGIYTNVWLDPRWGTFAFQVLQPTVSSITPAQGWPAASVTVNGSGFWSGPAEVFFCPQAGACQQGTIQPGYTDVQMTVKPPSMPAGTVANVQVLTDGGRSVTSAADLYTYGNPGQASIGASTPASGPPGTVERITATGFHPGETVNVSFPNGSTPVATPTANAQGAIDAAYVLPALPAGPYQVEVAGQTSGNLATAKIAITPGLTLHPASGAAGQSIVTSLLGFAAGEPVSLHWVTATGTVLAQGTTDSRGSLTTTFVVPAGLGAHDVYGVGTGGTASAVFTTTTTGTGSGLGSGLLTPSTGSPGTQILVHAVAGTFTKGDVVTVTAGEQSYQTAAGSDGSLLSTLVIPAGPTEGYTVTAIGAPSGKTVSAVLTVTPGIHLLPSSGPPGQSVAALVFGFPQGGDVTLHWASATGQLLTATPVAVDSFGSAVITFTIPPKAAASQPIYAVGPSGTQASALFTLT